MSGIVLSNLPNPHKNLAVKELAQDHGVIKVQSQNPTSGTRMAEPPNEEQLGFSGTNVN